LHFYLIGWDATKVSWLSASHFNWYTHNLDKNYTDTWICIVVLYVFMLVQSCIRFRTTDVWPWITWCLVGFTWWAEYFKHMSSMLFSCYVFTAEFWIGVFRSGNWLGVETECSDTIKKLQEHLNQQCKRYKTWIGIGLYCLYFDPDTSINISLGGEKIHCLRFGFANEKNVFVFFSSIQPNILTIKDIFGGISHLRQ
jgi:hypothetical protein